MTMQELTTPRCPFRLDPLAPDLHGENEHLRAMGPAARIELPGGVLATSVTSQALAKRLMMDDRVSKDPRRHWPAYNSGGVPAHWPFRIWVDIRNALSTYGEDHARLRQLIAPAFSPRRVRQLLPGITSIVDRRLDDLEARAEGPVDLRKDFAWLIPLQVVNMMLGIPEDLEETFRYLVGANMSTHYTPEQAAANGKAYYELLDSLIETKRRSPGDDITTHLVGLHDQGDVSRKELVDSLMLLVGAGHETTMNALDQACVNLLSHPAQLALVQSGQVSWDAVIDETLRHQSPVANILLRFAVETIHDAETGTTIEQGEAIVINLAAAGRDPLLHHQPADFDVTRAARRQHIAFGHGPHFCLGAELARLELRISLERLFRRFPSMTLAVPAAALKPLPSFISNGHAAIPALRVKKMPIPLHRRAGRAA
ncbi:cytochrome P450 family protein [Streptomyces anulatus]|uniref:cytochrome P450 family protein n=1 Tax=Streptomyces anulatus TaxID=1892 RepID=UPI001C256F6B|nr:cytochrome P450 [Streptomyces anulatus]